MVHDTRFDERLFLYPATNKTPPQLRTVKCLHMTCGKYQNDVSVTFHPEQRNATGTQTNDTRWRFVPKASEEDVIVGI